MNYKKLALYLLGLGFACFLVLLAFFLRIQFLMDKESVIEDFEEIDAVIILGARVEGNKPSLSLKYRLDKALEYLSKHPDTLVIVTGAQGEDEEIPESIVMRDYLIDKGYDKERIFTEEVSTSTYENLKEAKKLLDRELGEYKALIISQDYHLFRARMLAERVGMEVSTLEAKTPRESFLMSRLREFLAVIKSYLIDR